MGFNRPVFMRMQMGHRPLPNMGSPILKTQQVQGECGGTHAASSPSNSSHVQPGKAGGHHSLLSALSTPIQQPDFLHVPLPGQPRLSQYSSLPPLETGCFAVVFQGTASC